MCKVVYDIPLWRVWKLLYLWSKNALLCAKKAIAWLKKYVSWFTRQWNNFRWLYGWNHVEIRRNVGYCLFFFFYWPWNRRKSLPNTEGWDFTARKHLTQVHIHILQLGSCSLTPVYPLGYILNHEFFNAAWIIIIFYRKRLQWSKICPSVKISVIWLWVTRFWSCAICKPFSLI